MAIIKIKNQYHVDFEGETLAIFDRLDLAIQFAERYMPSVDC